MHKGLTRLFAAAVLTLMAGAASANQYPPGPGGTCLDSVTVYQIQNTAALCHPATGDTVYGVGGIITGFDPIATGFAFYMQTSGGGPFTGIDVFTHSKNTLTAPYNLAIGDSVICTFMATAEFGQGTEILATNNSFGSPNFSIRKISSGNTLPPFFVGTTTQLNELPTNVFGEQYEGALVRINGPLRVARTSLTGGLGSNNSFLLVSDAAVSDSVFIDGNILTTYAPPAVGSTINQVQGIYEQRARGYRIQLRDGNDIVTTTPPNVSDAYPIADNQIRVVFDRNVTNASATNTGNYSLASFGSVDAAVMDGQSAAIVTITNGLSHGDGESITINNVVGLANGVAMTTPQTRFFINGVLTCVEVQTANPDSLGGVPCLDRSRYAGGGGQTTLGNVGPRMTMTGICTGIYGSLYYIMDAGSPTRGGIAAFAPPVSLVVGRRYQFTGVIQEFFGESELSGIIRVTDLGATTTPAATSLTVAVARRDTCDAPQALNDGEDHEGTLVQLTGVKVVQRFNPLPTNGFHVAGEYPSNSDTIFVQNFNSVLSPFTHPTLGHRMTIIGHLHYEGNSFRVVPRNNADITDLGTAGVPEGGGALTFAVYPNPSRTAKLAFSLPVDADVELGIYDVSGRRIALIQKGELPAGNYTREWNGRDASGHTVGSGVYFARLKAGQETRSVRAVFLGQ